VASHDHESTGPHYNLHNIPHNMFVAEPVEEAWASQLEEEAWASQLEEEAWASQLEEEEASQLEEEEASQLEEEASQLEEEEAWDPPSAASVAGAGAAVGSQCS
jgi:hypothetical protein